MNTNLGPDCPNATAELRDQCDDWSLPWSLQSVAYLFLILGVLDVTEMVLQFTVSGNGHLDPFGPIFILMGRGLLLKRETWRYWAVLTCWFVVAVVCIGFVVLLWLFASGSTMVEELITSKPGASRTIIAGVLAVGFFYVWPLYVLTRPTIVRLFWTATTRAATGPATPTARVFFGRWTFSLRAMLLLMTVAAFVSWRLSDNDFLYKVYHESMVTSKGDFLNGVELTFLRSRFSNQPDQLLYAVLAHDGPQFPGVAALHSARDSQSGWIELPNGRHFALPGRNQLYEIHDGRLYTCDERILWRELKDYMDTNPDRYDLESLLNHVWALRGSQGQPPEKREVEF